jgi:hypothetical protein
MEDGFRAVPEGFRCGGINFRGIGDMLNWSFRHSRPLRAHPLRVAREEGGSGVAPNGACSCARREGRSVQPRTLPTSPACPCPRLACPREQLFFASCPSVACSPEHPPPPFRCCRWKKSTAARVRGDARPLPPHAAGGPPPGGPQPDRRAPSGAGRRGSRARPGPHRARREGGLPGPHRAPPVPCSNSRPLLLWRSGPARSGMRRRIAVRHGRIRSRHGA